MTVKKVAVISAVDSSTGEDAAWHLSSGGYEIAVLSSSDRGEAIAQGLGGTCITGSRRSAASVQRLVDRAMKRWGRVDVLVNSAECQLTGSMPDDHDRDLHAIMDAYLTNIVRPTRVVAPVMAELGGGTIVNVVNFAAFDPSGLAPALSVFRAAMVNFCTLVDHRYAAHGVKMANVVPEALAGRFQSEECGAGMPIWRFRKTAEISGLITCLVADTAHILSQNPLFDGGLTTSYKAAV